MGASYKWFFEDATHFREMDLVDNAVTNDVGTYVYVRGVGDTNSGSLVMDSTLRGPAFFGPVLHFLSPNFAIFPDATTNSHGTAILK